MNWSKRLCGLMILLTLAFIWGNSLLPAQQSGEVSEAVMELLNALLDAPYVDEGMHLLRKTAHFTEFFILGLELCWFSLLRGTAGMQRFSLPLLGGALAACMDETIQRFVPGRSASFVDVGIDICGLTLGIVLLLLGYAIFKKSKRHLEDKRP